MNNIGDNIRRSLQKRQVALNKFIAMRESFSQTREQTKNDIEEARRIMADTMGQLPENEFN